MDSESEPLVCCQGQEKYIQNNDRSSYGGTDNMWFDKAGRYKSFWQKLELKAWYSRSSSQFGLATSIGTNNVRSSRLPRKATMKRIGASFLNLFSAYIFTKGDNI